MDASFKATCIALRNEGRSIGEIMRATNRPKTSIYQHIRTIPLSARRKKEVREATSKRIRNIAIRRKGVPQRPFSGFSWTSGTVLLVAHLLFDGSVRRVGCEYNSRNEILVQRVEQLMQNVYTFPPKRYTDLRTGVLKIGFYNVALGAHVLEKTKELLAHIARFPLESRREFLRAFFDDEGCMDYRPKRNVRQIRGYQKDAKILETVRSLLSNFGISASVTLPNEVIIRGKENLLRFQKEINFSCGVRINGNRSNSIWKESLEKRLLLDRAIKSFKS